MHRFTHQYAARARVKYVSAPGGGLVSDTLIVSANIPLNPAAPGYDATKAAELEAAAVHYAQSLGNPYRSIELEEP